MGFTNPLVPFSAAKTMNFAWELRS
jgi:hypothetical protein